MKSNDFEILERVKDYNTFYFIESHLEQIHNDIELNLDSSYKCLKPLRKLNEKKLKDKDNQNYIATVYAIDFKPSLIKKKEIKNTNGESILIKLILKNKKNKFELQNYVKIESDSFTPYIQFEMKKKIFGKDVMPPTQMKLSNLQIMQIFNDTLLIKERKKINDITYIELLKFGVNLLKAMQTYELNLFYMIYVDILKNNNIELIKDIFNIFDMKKAIKPLNSNVLATYQEKLELVYNEQTQIIEKIKKIPNIDFKSYLIKFYTIQIYMFVIIENYEISERIMLDLRDNNPFDNLILARLYLSEYSQFYRNIPISLELQNSLMGQIIYTSTNYNELVTSFTLISDFTKRNFPNILLIITQNYDKINEICRNSKTSLNINDFINQNPNDDLLQIQNHLDFITKKKLENNFKSINFNINMWDLYLANNNNKPFWEYLKSNLIIGSLHYDELAESLFYIIKYTNKNFIEMLDLIVKNYDKLRSICMNERRQIMINDFIEPSVNDNPEKIKEYLSYIVSEKLKDRYETIFFNINIWNFYIFNHFQFEFLSFLEMKLYEAALNSKEIFDCLLFSSNFVNKSFAYMLEKVLYNFDKIQNIFKAEKTFIMIEKYIVQQEQTDDLSKIYELIKAIIEKEKINLYCTVKFNVDLWFPYSNSQVLDTLKFIRKIINDCKTMEPEISEDKIQLSTKIHHVGFIEIQRGILTGEKLLQFLGEDEAFYVDKQINQCIQKNIYLQNLIDSQANEIKNLRSENGNLKKEINNLSSENSSLKSRISSLESGQSHLESKISSIESNCNSLESKINSISTS